MKQLINSRLALSGHTPTSAAEALGVTRQALGGRIDALAATGPNPSLSTLRLYGILCGVPTGVVADALDEDNPALAETARRVIQGAPKPPEGWLQVAGRMSGTRDWWPDYRAVLATCEAEAAAREVA